MKKDVYTVHHSVVFNLLFIRMNQGFSTSGLGLQTEHRLTHDVQIAGRPIMTPQLMVHTPPNQEHLFLDTKLIVMANIHTRESVMQFQMFCILKLSQYRYISQLVFNLLFI